MTSRKRSATKRQRETFEAGVGGMDDLFARAEREHDRLEGRREQADRARSCERKNRYATRAEAQEAIARCADNGRRGLSCYRCEYCGGWHLTSRKA